MKRIADRLQRGRWPAMVAVALVLCGCSRQVSTEVKQQIAAAQEAFDRAASRDDFLRVAGMYEQIARSGVNSGAVFYNQGNAFARADERGRAIAAYRKAKRYRPTDPLLDANLRSTVLGSDTMRSRPMIEYLFFWQNWIGYPAKFRLSLWAAAIGFLAGIASWIWSNSVIRALGILSLVVTLAVSASAAYDWYRFEFLRHGVTVRESIARKGNASTYEPAFTAPLPEASEFLVVEQRGNWFRIELPGGEEAWLPEDDIALY